MPAEFLISLKADGEKRDRGSVYLGRVEEPYHRLLPCSLYIELFHASISIYTEALTAVCGKSDCLVSDSRKVP